MAAIMKASDNNSILNTPYDEPGLHYATDSTGNIHYADIRKGRRVFYPDVPKIPWGQESQGSIFDLNDLAADYREHLVNLVREQVTIWRNASCSCLTRVSRELLAYCGSKTRTAPVGGGYSSRSAKQ